MIGFDAAQALLAAAVAPLPAERVALDAAAGRVLAAPVLAAIAAPRCDVAAMDGYAVGAGDDGAGARLTVIGESAAGGAPPPPLTPGTAVRIFTGAPMPQGAVRVIIQENCEAQGGLITIAQPPGAALHLRRAGSDFAAGQTVLAAGRRLDPAALVMLAGADCDHAAVHRQPPLAVIATGDELVPPGSARGHALAVPESVSHGVAAMAAAGGAVIAGRHRGRDDIAALEALAAKALAAAEVVVVTGGASVGERDFARAMFAPHGLDLLFSKVAMKPGKPVWLGRAQDRWVLGLPGNPTSAMVTARLFMAPLLAALQGADPAAALDWLPLPLAGPLPATGDRDTFYRMGWSAAGLIAVGNQDSAAQQALVEARWLVRRAAGSSAAAAGTTVPALRL